MAALHSTATVGSACLRQSAEVPTASETQGVLASFIGVLDAELCLLGLLASERFSCRASQLWCCVAGS